MCVEAILFMHACMHTMDDIDGMMYIYLHSFMNIGINDRVEPETGPIRDLGRVRLKYIGAGQDFSPFSAFEIRGESERHCIFEARAFLASPALFVVNFSFFFIQKEKIFNFGSIR